ncbi:maleylpyruvate isomerase family mycothiol-dependent enzyme [Saccharothrix violaceirubra]|uniref:Uncharacterized protein (TIGR03083 family) n=1 Tax=Saccharothrix violaceirubra TaxID=413306 RepID=A0A7W7T8Z6_9PSEU|nr:maleylpyruvate isomerase family mycothiol-dependent enzyme [Saccharothrix violaceirubra]MBB4968744.1 uncharacterized protein (TIGR03083 family) [Saccharothrix violaceirubra]
MGPNHVEAVERYGAAFTEAATGNPGVPVPACPGWTVEDLAAHLAAVQGRWAVVLDARGEPPDPEDLRRAAETGPDRLAGWREAHARYLAAQRDCPAYVKVPVWWTEEGRDTAAAVAERQAHEVVVHCWDAWQAVGAARSVPADLAADGVTEFLRRFLTGPDWPHGPLTVRLRATDTDDEWLVATDGTARPRLVTGNAPGLATLTGTAEELYLVLWRRLPLDRVDPTGPAAGFVAWPDLT